MKFILLVKSNPVTEAGEEGPEGRGEAMSSYNAELASRGALLEAAGLYPSGEGSARIRHVDDEVDVVRGRFAEPDQLVAGGIENAGNWIGSEACSGAPDHGRGQMIRTATFAATMLLTTAALAQSEPVGQTVPVNGMDMYYEVSGEGDPLIVLHGSYLNIQTMGEIVPRLAETHKVYAIEFQGHGRTNDIDRPITYPNLAGDVAAFMDAVGIEKADVFGYSMGAAAGLWLAIEHPEKVDQLVAASVAYDAEGWQPAFTDFIPQMVPEMFVGTPMEDEWKQLAPNPEGFRSLVEKLIALEKEPMAWEEEVKELDTPVLIIAGDADVSTLEHNVALFRLLGGGEMGDMGTPLSASRLAVLPATSHTAVFNQTDLLHGFIEPFLQGETPAGFMGQ